jgi:hypothetical protein
MRNIVKSSLFSAAVILAMIVAEPVRSLACQYDHCSSVNYGGLAIDTFSLAMERHAISFTAEADDVILIRMNRSYGTLVPRLELYAPNEQLIATTGLGTPGIKILDKKLYVPGSYTIVADDLYGGGTGRYGLSLQCSNRPGNPKSLTYDNMIRDTIVEVSEMKAYQFDALAGDVVSIQMISITRDIDPQIELYAPDGSRVTSARDTYHASTGDQPLFVSGTYTIITSDYRGDEPGQYFLILLHIPVDVDDDDQPMLPTDFVLHQNYPNPFNPVTKIGLTLPRSTYVALNIFDILGARVRTLVSGQMPAGNHTIMWDSRNEAGDIVPSGIYFYRVTADNFEQTRKMLLVK